MVNVARKGFIKKSDLSKGDKITFTDEGAFVEKDFSTDRDGSQMKTVFIINILLNDDTQPREWTLNATTRNALSEAWGSETKEWIRKVAIVDFIKMMSFGKMTEVICLTPTDDVAAEPAIAWDE
ncbi:hypothetical protein HQ584_01150 [Patescibacteria group bacterium]|nr:hypothetical protein [Patescibacteria group bacterium]